MDHTQQRLVETNFVSKPIEPGQQAVQSSDQQQILRGLRAYARAES